MTALCTLVIRVCPLPSGPVAGRWPTAGQHDSAMSVAIGTLRLMVRSPSGVDPSLVAEMLHLSPEERLRLNDRTIASVQELRRAFAAKRSDDAAVSTRR